MLQPNANHGAAVARTMGDPLLGSFAIRMMNTLLQNETNSCAVTQRKPWQVAWPSKVFFSRNSTLSSPHNLHRSTAINRKTLASLVNRTFWRSAGMLNALARPAVKGIPGHCAVNQGLGTRRIASQVGDTGTRERYFLASQPLLFA